MRSGFRLSCVWVSIQLVSVVSAATIKSTCGMVKFKPAKSENEEALCAISPSPTAATSMKTKVQCSWACAHSGDTCAAGFNFKEQQALCEMFANPPTTLEVQQDCEYYTVCTPNSTAYYFTACSVKLYIALAFIRLSVLSSHVEFLTCIDTCSYECSTCRSNTNIIVKQ